MVSSSSVLFDADRRLVWGLSACACADEKKKKMGSGSLFLKGSQGKLFGVRGIPAVRWSRPAKRGIGALDHLHRESGKKRNERRVRGVAALKRKEDTARVVEVFFFITRGEKRSISAGSHVLV